MSTLKDFIEAAEHLKEIAETDPQILDYEVILQWKNISNDCGDGISTEPIDCCLPTISKKYKQVIFNGYDEF